MQLERIHLLIWPVVLNFLRRGYAEGGGRVIFPRGPGSAGFSNCTTPDGDPGECIIVNRCRYLIQKQDYNLLRKSLCGFQGDIPKVCCQISRQVTRPFKQTIPPFTQSIHSTTEIAKRPLIAGQPSKKNDFITQSSTPSTWRTDPDIPPTSGFSGRGSMRRNSLAALLPQDCGKNSVTFRRIVGGSEAVGGAWPWMAAVYLQRRGIKSAECGGALISAKHVITAAHCIVSSRRGKLFNPRIISVRLGDHDLDSDTDDADPINVNVKSVVKHEKFELRTFQNDIAILELAKPVKFGKFIRPICLPLNDTFEEDKIAGKNAFAAGWGTISFNGPASSKLQEVQLRIWKNKDCEDMFKKDAPITIANICAGDGVKDSCRGDSGGPLMLPAIDGRFYLVGIVSFGKKCAEPNYPGVYARVTTFLSWIEDKIKSSV